jgi:endonuclease/exonuclease/phosphatase family metal-dependent hydrolase
MRKISLLLLTVLLAGMFVSLTAAEKVSIPLRIMTYNIRYDNPGDGTDNWNVRKDYIFSLLKFNAPDIFCIQEGLNNQVNDLTAALPDYDHVGVGRDDGKAGGEYSAVFYNKDRFLKLETGNFWLSQTPDVPSLGWDAACIRICTWVRLMDVQNQKEFTVFNTHFDHVGKVARESSARLIAENLKKIGRDKSVLLTGDFNAPDTDIVYTILTTETDLLDSGKSTLLPHHGTSKTWYGFYYGRESEPSAIDFIFTSNGIKTLKHATLSEIMDNGHFPSDHLPVMAEVVLP